MSPESRLEGSLALGPSPEAPGSGAGVLTPEAVLWQGDQGPQLRTGSFCAGLQRLRVPGAQHRGPRGPLPNDGGV